MSERAIAENILRGIATALHAHAPNLLPIVSRLVADNEAVSAVPGLGKSAFGKLHGSVPLLDGQAVSNELHAIDRTQGEGVMFDGLQINFLANEWDKFYALPAAVKRSS